MACTGRSCEWSWSEQQDQSSRNAKGVSASPLILEGCLLPLCFSWDVACSSTALLLSAPMASSGKPPDPVVDYGSASILVRGRTNVSGNDFKLEKSRGILLTACQWFEHTRTAFVDCPFNAGILARGGCYCCCDVMRCDAMQ